jgi:hypothetical protein
VPGIKACFLKECMTNRNVLEGRTEVTELTKGISIFGHQAIHVASKTMHKVEGKLGSKSLTTMFH